MKNIVFKHTLEEYNKKYRNREYKLLKISKKQVEDFDKENPIKKGYLLEGKKWWFIGDTYYQIPRPISFTWFRNLKTGIQVATLLAPIVAGASALLIIKRNLIFFGYEEIILGLDENQFAKSGFVIYNKNSNLKKGRRYKVKANLDKTINSVKNSVVEFGMGPDARYTFNYVDKYTIRTDHNESKIIGTITEHDYQKLDEFYSNDHANEYLVTNYSLYGYEHQNILLGKKTFNEDNANFEFDFVSTVTEANVMFQIKGLPRS